MKKILFRKILLDSAYFFFFSLLATSLIIWIFQAVNYLDIMIEDGRSYITYIQYTLLNFPKVISKILPFVLFFSFMYIINKYEQNNELIIFWHIGIHKLQFIKFFFIISIALTVLQIFFTSIIVPSSQELSRNLLRTSDVNFFESFIKTKKFNDTIKGVTIYVESKDEEGNLKNIYLEKNTSSENFQITYAKRGMFRYNNNIQKLTLYDGETISSVNNNINNFKFSKSDFNLNQFDTRTITVIKTQETSSKDLIKCLLNLSNTNTNKNLNNQFFLRNCNLNNLSNIFKELYKRYIIPLYIPIIILVALLLIITSKENVNHNKYKIIIYLTGFFLIIFSETTLRFVEDTMLDNYKLIIIPFILLFVIIIFFYSKLFFKTQ